MNIQAIIVTAVVGAVHAVVAVAVVAVAEAEQIKTMDKKVREKFVVQWHITSKCNLRCKHCYQSDYSKDLDNDELVKIFYKIKDYFDSNDYRGHINFTGGESFVSDSLWPLLDLCEKFGISFGILSNGTLIDREIVKRLSKYSQLKFVQISIDGSRKVHDEIRGKGSYDKSFEAIDLLNRTSIETMVSFTLSNKNKGELKKVIRECEKAKVSRFWTDRLIPIGSNKLDIISTKDYKKCIDILGKEIRRAEFLRKIGMNKTYIHNNRALQFLCDCGKYSHDGYYECSAGKKLLAILEDGTVLPCRRLPLELGNIAADSVDNILKDNEVIKEINDCSLDEKCKDCLFKYNCNGGSKCLTYTVKGELKGKDVNCWL